MVDQYQNLESSLIGLGLLMVRMLLAFSFMPFFSTKVVPLTVRLSFVAGLSLFLFPLLQSQLPLFEADWHILFPCLLKEAGLGMVLGVFASLSFWAFHTAGVIIEYQAGLTMSVAIDPLSGEEDSLIGGLFMQLLTVFFFISGGMRQLVDMLFESYVIWPINKMLPIVGNLKLITMLMAAIMQMIVLVVKIAAPFVILMLLVELALGLLSRFAPQLNVFFLSLPLKVGILAVLLLIYSSLLSDGMQLLPNFHELNKTLEGVLR
ncbi:type III secretion protein T [Collimonas sp. PA-H2]|uniref:type III secretion system export apparatus subunit SctT n=1 Tax=Collimonas sp. PA-H2 TaxID=1881062 RepID=UPI000BF6AD20|nr:type III secretion system export apparatus subunit SctT [Collimonas sp. PA-H2]PFH08644.1 type III secretion protein T [Collimonas sp. PA-H2]